MSILHHLKKGHRLKARDVEGAPAGTVRLRVRDFTTTPGGRFRVDGQHSAEEFYEERLRPKFEKAVEDNSILELDLTGVLGYTVGWLDGTFGRLSSEYKKEIVNKHLSWNIEPYRGLNRFIKEYIEEERYTEKEHYTRAENPEIAR